MIPESGEIVSMTGGPAASVRRLASRNVRDAVTEAEAAFAVQNDDWSGLRPRRLAERGGGAPGAGAPAGRRRTTGSVAGGLTALEAGIDVGGPGSVQGLSQALRARADHLPALPMRPRSSATASPPGRS
ncbi:hypothetical protein [Streptomyces sp. NPDC014006]|uniref:hypothetical protein n=1 Tax=Streptomyces sp. NPDC014006 TaxID=3364870 RepID=UPI0037034E1F